MKATHRTPSVRKVKEAALRKKYNDLFMPIIYCMNRSEKLCNEKGAQREQFSIAELKTAKFELWAFTRDIVNHLTTVSSYRQ